MPVTNYYTVNGSIIGEQTTGQPDIDYLTDALGSVTATVDQTGAVQNTYRYKPYGAQLARTGSESDPSFTWVGEQGYREISTSEGTFYVRARHSDVVSGNWTTRDPSGYEDGLNLFAYVHGKATTATDSTGLGCREPDRLARCLAGIQARVTSCQNFNNINLTICGGSEGTLGGCCVGLGGAVGIIGGGAIICGGAAWCLTLWVRFNNYLNQWSRNEINCCYKAYCPTGIDPTEPNGKCVRPSPPPPKC